MSGSAQARILVAALAPTIVLLSTAAAASVRTSQAQPSGEITFAAADGIAAVGARGGTPKLIVRAPGDADYAQPAWSPGGHLAVTRNFTPSEGTGSSDVYVVRPKPQQPVFGGISGFSEMPSWAPDGRRIVLVGLQFSDPYAIGGLYISAPGSRKPRNLTPERDVGGDRAPAWSPDGSWIAFARSEYGASPLHLYLIHPNGTGLRRLTSTVGDNPSCGPNSRRLVFDDGHRIVAIGADGRNLVYLSKGPNDSDPAWSPDAKTIAFIRSGDLWIMDRNGRGAKRIDRTGYDPAWRRP